MEACVELIVEEMSISVIEQHSLFCPNQKFKRDQKLGVLRLPCVSCVLLEGLVVYGKMWKGTRWYHQHRNGLGRKFGLEDH